MHKAVMVLVDDVQTHVAAAGIRQCYGSGFAQVDDATRVDRVPVRPDSHLLVSGSPDVRRKFIDWGMFHVKHEFLDVWRRYSVALKQRNAALRLQQVDVLDALDSIVAEQGTRLSELREAHVTAVAARLGPMLEQLNTGLAEIRIDYQPGWSGDSLGEALRRNRGRDQERGLTHSGPHRCDLSLLCGETSARSMLSRGEQKLLAAALLLVQAELLAGLGENPVYLLDDLASEFDQAHFERVLGCVLGGGGQVWLTGTRQQRPVDDCTMFHVEQGSVAEMI